MAKKLMLISADCHAGVHPRHYAEWLDPKYRDGVDELISHNTEFEKHVWPVIKDESDEPIVDSRRKLADGARSGLWDPAVRLREMEEEGFVAEIMFPGDQETLGMYYSNLNRPWPAEYRAAGTRAYNRWLAEFCSHAPGRMIGIAQMEPWPDMDACVKAIHSAKSAGLGAVGLPRFPGIEPNQPHLGSRAWDPFWKACVDTDLTVAVHIGHGTKQGTSDALFQAVDLKKTGFPDQMANGDIVAGAGQRPLWQMILSGAFDRFPDLRMTFSELRCEWVAPLLAHLEMRFEQLRFKDAGFKMPKLRPTDYWHRNCALGASSARPFEVSLRHQIGVRQMMYGSDYPHPEGSWPNSRDWLRVAFDGVPEDEARLILGENAARVYRLDVAKLSALAEKFGPEPKDILSGAADIPRKLVDNFQWRGGFLSRPTRYDPSPVDTMIDEDVRIVA